VRQACPAGRSQSIEAPVQGHAANPTRRSNKGALARWGKFRRSRHRRDERQRSWKFQSLHSRVELTCAMDEVSRSGTGRRRRVGGETVKDGHKLKRSDRHYAGALIAFRDGSHVKFPQGRDCHHKIFCKYGGFLRNGQMPASVIPPFSAQQLAMPASIPVSLRRLAGGRFNHAQYLENFRFGNGLSNEFKRVGGYRCSLIRNMKVDLLVFLKH
jgi:hypothetical protein